MGNQLVYLQVAVSMERKSLLWLKSMEAHQAIFKLATSATVSSLAIVAGCDSPPPVLSVSNCVGQHTLSSAVQRFEGCRSESLLSEDVCKLNRPASRLSCALTSRERRSLNSAPSLDVQCGISGSHLHWGKCQPVTHREQIQPLCQNSTLNYSWLGGLSFHLEKN